MDNYTSDENSFKRKKFFIGTSFVVIGVAILLGFLLLIRGCSSAYDENFLKGNVQAYTVDGKDYIAGLHEFNKCTNFSSENGMTWISMHYYYFLQTRQAATGNIVKETEITEAGGKQAEILGGKGGLVWLWVKNRFLVYNVATHDKIDGNAKISEVNPFLKGNIPDDGQYVKFDNFDKTIHITAKNGIYYQIDCDTFRAEEDKREKQADDRLRDVINSVADNGIRGHEIALRAMDKDTIYAILSEKEANGGYVPKNTSIGYDIKRRQIYTSKAVSRDMETAFSSVEKWTPSDSHQVFLNGGFLVNPENLSVIRLENPAGFLVLQLKQIGKGSPLVLSRIGLDGNTVWNTELPVSKITGVVYTKGALVFLSNDGTKITDNHESNIYLQIDLNSGKFKTIDLFGETRKGFLKYLFF